MPINFDPNSLNNVFDKNFGAGAYNAGLSNARNAAMLKVKANYAQQDMTKRINAARTKALKDQEYLSKYGMTYDDYQAQQAQKKQNGTFDSALNYWSDKKKDLQSKGAYQTANDLLNDPQAQEDLKNQGYDLSKIVDAAYNVASNGKFKSKKSYDQYATQLDKSNTDKKANQDSIDLYIQKAKQAEADKKVQQQKAANASKMNWYDKLNAGGQRIGDQFLRTVFGDNFANWNNQQDKELAQYELKKNPNNTHAIKALTRDNAAYSKASTTGEKLLNYTGGIAGNILPFLVGDGLLGAGEKALASATKGTAQKVLTSAINPSNLVKNTIRKKALQGATSGLVGGGLQMGAHNIMSGEQYTPEQIRNNLLLYGGSGAVLNPALYGVGKGMEAAAGKAMKGLLPKNQDVANVLAAGMRQEPLGLPAPKLQLPPPKEVQPSLETFFNAGNKPSGLQSPIPSMPITMRNAMLKNNGIGFGSTSSVNSRIPVGKVNNSDLLDMYRGKPFQTEASGQIIDKQPSLMLNAPSEPLGLNAPIYNRVVQGLGNDVNVNGVPQLEAPKRMSVNNQEEATQAMEHIRNLTEMQSQGEQEYVKQVLSPHLDALQQQANAEAQWQSTVKNAKEVAQNIKNYYGKISVPKSNKQDFKIPNQFKANKNERGYDIYKFADDEGFASVDEAVNFLQNIDQESRLRLSDLTPDKKKLLSENQLKSLEEKARSEYRRSNIGKGNDQLITELVDSLHEYANTSGNPLNFKTTRQFNVKDEPLSYVGKMDPRQQTAVRGEGAYQTNRVGDKLKINVTSAADQPRPFKKTIEVPRSTMSKEGRFTDSPRTNDISKLETFHKVRNLGGDLLKTKLVPKEETLKDLLKADPRIKELVKGLYLKAPKQSVSRPATLDEMVQRLESMAPSKQEPKPLEPLQFRVPKGFNPKLEPNILNRDVPGKNVSNSSLFMKASSLKSENVLKTVSINKTLDAMSKDELKTVYKQLEDKKASLTAKKASKKQIAKIEEDLKKVNDFLMKPDLQMFGKAAEKKSTVQPSATKPQRPIKQQQAIEAQKQKKLVEDYKKKKNDLKAEIAQMMSNSDKWKNKGDLALGRETMQRNFEDIMGKDAEKFKKKFLEPISSREAERVRFLNTEREWAKSHEIKPKSLEDQLVQMYGEKKITLDELKQKTLNWKKVVKVSEAYRIKYDKLLTTVNKVLEDNGFPPIPKRADYFPHYEEIDGLMKKLGFDMNNNALPTDINGLTDNFKPNKQFFSNALRRKGDETTFGAIQGFDRYLEGISNVIYHTKNIRQLRALDDVIRTKYQDQDHLSTLASKITEYTNLLAGKKSRVDRSLEDVVGRKIYNVVDSIRRRTGANIVGANLSSALTNFIPLTHSLATTNKQAFVKGMADTLANIGKNDGFIQKSDFLTKRIGSDPLYRNLWDKTVDKSMWLMRNFDSFTSQVIVRGKYNELIAKGVPEEQAIKQADNWANRIIAGRGKGDMPTLFGSKAFGILSQFQLEVNNQLSFLFKDLPRNSPNKAALASSVGQILLYSYMFNNLYEKAVGRRPAFDPVGIAFQTVKDYNNDNLTKGEATKNLGTNIANQLPFTSVFTGGRFPISSGMPDIGGIATGTADWKGEVVKPLLYLGLPTGGGQLKKVVEGITAMNKNPLSPQGTTGVYQGDKLKFPVANNIPNNLRGPLFGKYSFPEAQDFYDNSRSALSAKQTKQVEINPDYYINILEQQRLKRLKKQAQGK
jgi:hypothetical protein